MKKKSFIVFIFSLLLLLLLGSIPAFSFSGEGSCLQVSYYVRESWEMDLFGKNVYTAQFDSEVCPVSIRFTDELSILEGIDLPLIRVIETQQLFEDHKQRLIFLSSV